MTFHTDGTIYRANFESGSKVTFGNTVGRHVFLYLTSGQISVNDQLLQEKDQARADIDTPLILEARKNSELILIDVPSCKAKRPKRVGPRQPVDVPKETGSTRPK
ncbi:MAG: hypothetical protein JSV60_05960 [Desulfobacterales bacterium]|nr:MAG: hypothetical protein JSV60_05960 [Desulfobacterales bacterium]